MRRTTIVLAAAALVLALTAPAAAATQICPGAYVEPGISVDVDSVGFSVFVGPESAGEHLTVRAGKTLIFKGAVDPYFSWANAWPDSKQTLTLKFRGGDRYVWSPDCG